MDEINVIITNLASKFSSLVVLAYFWDTVSEITTSALVIVKSGRATTYLLE